MQPRMAIAVDSHVGNICSPMTLGDLFSKAVDRTISLYGQRGRWRAAGVRGFTEPWCKRQDYYPFYCGSTTTTYRS